MSSLDESEEETDDEEDYYSEDEREKKDADKTKNERKRSSFGEEGEGEGGLLKSDTDSLDDGPPPCSILSRRAARTCLRELNRLPCSNEYAFTKLTLSHRSLLDITTILNFKYVRIVDLSHNNLTDLALEVLTEMESLEQINADWNYLHVPRLGPMNRLRQLHISHNNITSLDGINIPELVELQASYNNLSPADILIGENCKHLQILGLYGNKIKSLNVIQLDELKELYIGGNAIKTLDGAERFEALVRLNLRDNPITSLSGLSHNMEKLEYVNVRYCRIDDEDEFQKFICLPKLNTIVIFGNSFVKTNRRDYRVKMLLKMPFLRRIDKKEIHLRERVQAEIIEMKLSAGYTLDELEDAEEELDEEDLDD